MTQNRLKNTFNRPKKFDNQIDQISYVLQKMEIYDQKRKKTGTTTALDDVGTTVVDVVGTKSLDVVKRNYYSS